MIKETENGGMMQDFISGFEDDGWIIDPKGKLVMKSDDGESEFAFVDYKNFNREINIREISLKKGNESYRLVEYSLENTIEYILIMPQYRGEPLGQEEGATEIFYRSDGLLSDNRSFLGLPMKIDMKKTAEMFLKQVAEKKFETPTLVRASE